MAFDTRTLNMRLVLRRGRDAVFSDKATTTLPVHQLAFSPPSRSALGSSRTTPSRRELPSLPEDSVVFYRIFLEASQEEGFDYKVIIIAAYTNIVHTAQIHIRQRSEAQDRPSTKSIVAAMLVAKPFLSGTIIDSEIGRFHNHGKP